MDNAVILSCSLSSWLRSETIACRATESKSVRVRETSIYNTGNKTTGNSP